MNGSPLDFGISCRYGHSPPEIIRCCCRTGELYRGSEYVVDFLPKIKLEILAPDSMVDSIVDAVTKAAKTDKIGDGKIFVQQVEECIRIRTGERGDEAI